MWTVYSLFNWAKFFQYTVFLCRIMFTFKNTSFEYSKKIIYPLLILSFLMSFPFATIMIIATIDVFIYDAGYCGAAPPSWGLYSVS